MGHCNMVACSSHVHGSIGFCKPVSCCVQGKKMRHVCFPNRFQKKMSQKYGTHYRTDWPEARTLLRLDSSESGDAALSGQSLVDIVALYFFTFPHGKYL